MTKSTSPARITVICLAMALLYGCKIMDDKVENGFSGAGGERNGGAGESSPTIWGDPETAVMAGAGYAFQPEAEDADGDVLRFAIENKPSWASFQTATGLLQGIPGSGHVGTHAGIVISVSDGSSVTSLPSFAITVEAAGAPPSQDDDDPTGSTPPSISGKPNTSVVAGQAYSFQPDASDPDGDPLSFSIVNRPAWATFETTTGRLHGTPGATHLGKSRSIEISATDGASIAALPRFTITVEAVGTVAKAIEWTPPTHNEDGTPLTDLAGYRIYYGTASGDYSNVIEVDAAGVTSYVVEGLAPGTYYLVMTSFNSRDVESDYTPEISFELGS